VYRRQLYVTQCPTWPTSEKIVCCIAFIVLALCSAAIESCLAPGVPSRTALTASIDSQVVFQPFKFVIHLYVFFQFVKFVWFLVQNVIHNCLAVWWYNYYHVELQVSHASWKVLNFFLKFPGPGKSSKMSLVPESPGVYLWLNLTNMLFMYRAPCVNNKSMKSSCCVLTEQFLCHLCWTFCNGLYSHTVDTE